MDESSLLVEQLSVLEESVHVFKKCSSSGVLQGMKWREEVEDVEGGSGGKVTELVEDFTQKKYLR